MKFMETPNELFAKFKKAVFGPFFDFFKSDRGNKCMKKIGPIIVFLYYLLQITHIYFFTVTMTPILFMKFPNLSFILTVLYIFHQNLINSIAICHYWILHAIQMSLSLLQNYPYSSRIAKITFSTIF